MIPTQLSARAHGETSLLKRPRAVWFWFGLIAIVGLLRLVAMTQVVGDAGLVPDEGLYVQILDRLKQGADPYELGQELGYGSIVITNSAILLAPAWLLNSLGFASIDALRAGSIVLSSASAALLVVTISLIRRAKRSESAHPHSGRWLGDYSVVSAPGLATITFLLLPSHLLWNSLALRESASEVSALLTAFGIAVYLIAQRWVIRLTGALLVIPGLVGVQLSRSYLAAFLVLGVLAISVWWPRCSKPRVALPLIAAAIGGFALGQIVMGSVQSPEIVTPTPGSELVISGDNEVTTAGEVTTAAEGTNARVPSFFESQVMARIDSRVTQFSLNREKFAEAADSAYPYNYCVADVPLSESLGCELAHLPLGVSRFIATPLALPWDVPEKPSNILAGVENWLWLGLFAAALITLIGRKTFNARFVTMLVVYGSLAIVGYAFVSGNAGSAFRHKSQFLWVLCLIIALGAQWRPWVTRLWPRRGESTSTSSFALTGRGEKTLT